MPVSRHPWMGSLTLTDADTNYSIRELVDALDASIVPSNASGRNMVVQWLAIQLDVGAGGARLYIGNPNNLSGTNCGVELVATQVWSIWSMPTNLVNVDDIYVRSNTAGVRINVTFMRL